MSTDEGLDSQANFLTEQISEKFIKQYIKYPT